MFYFFKLLIAALVIYLGYKYTWFVPLIICGWIVIVSVVGYIIVSALSAAIDRWTNS